MRHFGLIFGVLFVALTHSRAASAQCTRDVDCKGQRICVAGACVEPALSPAPQAGSAATTAPMADGGEPGGWGSGAAILGYLAAGGTLLLATASEVTKEDQIPALPLGVLATATIAAVGPVVASGGSSARRGGAAEGVMGLRIAGWITYGVSLANAAVLIVLGINEVTPIDGQIVATGIIGGASLVLLAADAAMSADEARTRAGRAQLDVQPDDEGLAWTPVLVPIATGEATGGVIGLAARF